jgi:hypothetical protein
VISNRILNLQITIVLLDQEHCQKIEAKNESIEGDIEEGWRLQNLNTHRVITGKFFYFDPNAASNLPGHVQLFVITVPLNSLGTRERIPMKE